MIRTKTTSVTQQDIADQLGVNQKTVSMAFRSPERLRPETVERIVTTARQLGYRPNAGARAIRSGRFNSIALISSALEWRSNMPSEMLAGIQDVLEAEGNSLSLWRMTDAELADESKVPKALTEIGADGALINYEVNIPDRMLELIKRFRIPAVWLNAKLKADCVRPDDFDASAKAVEHLVSLGHREIVYIDLHHAVSKEGRHYSRDDRRLGYLRAMKKAGLKAQTILPVRGRGRGDWLAYVANQLKRMPKVTAVMGYGGSEPGIVLRAVEVVLGKRVPDDLSIMTVSSARRPTICDLPLTAMVVPAREVGCEAARLLSRKIRQPAKSFAPVLVPFELCEGASCATRA